MKTVEKELEMNRPEFSKYDTEPIFQNMTVIDLKKAAEFFIFLNVCPYTPTSKSSFILWADFYANLFGAQSPDHIILTLNRLKEVGNNPNIVFLKIIAQNLLNRIAQMLSLKYEDIISMLPGLLNNVSLNADLSSFNSFTKESM